MWSTGWMCTENHYFIADCIVQTSALPSDLLLGSTRINQCPTPGCGSGDAPVHFDSAQSAFIKGSVVSSWFKDSSTAMLVFTIRIAAQYAGIQIYRASVLAVRPVCMRQPH